MGLDVLVEGTGIDMGMSGSYLWVYEVLQRKMFVLWGPNGENYEQ